MTDVVFLTPSSEFPWQLGIIPPPTIPTQDVLPVVASSCVSREEIMSGLQDWICLSVILDEA